MKRLIVALAVAAATPAMAQTADLEALKAEAAGRIKDFGGTLKGELQAAMEKGGPVNAISVCNDRAPAIAKAKSTDGWLIGRTSLKLRNAASRPDAWDKAALDEFEARKAKGEDPAGLAKAAIVERDGGKVFRFIKAIPTEELCLNCHGGELKPEVAAALDKLYPQDKARGFKAGDLRGAFVLEKKL